MSSSLLSKATWAVAVLLPWSVSAIPKVCTNPLLSCGTSTSTDLCCFNSPGGQFLQTQFWDTNPSTGPVNSWTVHGLWPDHCDGTYDANCDTTRAYTNITAILKAAGQTSLLTYMGTYWKDYQGNDEDFWEHEWAKHGTCISTLKPSCYTSYVQQEEVVDYFETTVNLFKSLDSYAALSKAGIVPSSTATYTAAAIQAALKTMFGFAVTIQCSSGALNEIWYTFGVRGSVATGEFVRTAPNGNVGTCPTTGIKYLPKSGTATPTTTSGAPAATGAAFSGTGYLNAYTSSSQTGCLITAGTWYATGSCATFTATASGSGFVLKTSKGNCAVSSSIITCASGLTASVFTASGGKLAYNGVTSFYAAAVPSGTTQQSVYTTSKAVGVTFQWQSV